MLDLVIEFRTPQLQKLCETFMAGSRKWGDQVMKKVVQRLNELQEARNLEDLRNLAPGSRPHALDRKYCGKFAVDLHGGYRMVFEPTNDPNEYQTRDGIDRSKITAIRIMEIEDSHG